MNWQKKKQLKKNSLKLKKPEFFSWNYNRSQEVEFEKKGVKEKKEEEEVKCN